MIAAIIQARMTSTRLPSKIMMEVNNRPLLDYMIERVTFIKKIDQIIIATTTNREDDVIEEYAGEKGLSYYRGSEHDVLDRYYQTAKKFSVDHVMRITSDNTLIDPTICDNIIEVYFKTVADYAHTDPTFAEGVDFAVLSYKALEKTWLEANLRSEREHVTLYIHNHPELFNIVTVSNETDDSEYRFTVDEHEDFLVVKTLIENLYKENQQVFLTNEIKHFLDNHPDIYKLNRNVVRNEGLVKSLKVDTLLPPRRKL